MNIFLPDLTHLEIILCLSHCNRGRLRVLLRKDCTEGCSVMFMDVRYKVLLIITSCHREAPL